MTVIANQRCRFKVPIAVSGGNVISSGFPGPNVNIDENVYRLRDRGRCTSIAHATGLPKLPAWHRYTVRRSSSEAKRTENRSFTIARYWGKTEHTLTTAFGNPIQQTLVAARIAHNCWPTRFSVRSSGKNIRHSNQNACRHARYGTVSNLV